MTSRAYFPLILAFILLTTSAKAHEVWIEPEAWHVPKDEAFTAQILNGQDFTGSELSWDPRVIVRAEKWQGDTGVQLVSRFGDTPAISAVARADGLLTLLYQSKPNTLVYTEYEKFTEFLSKKGHADIIARHAARNLPKTAIKEAFSRFSKALVAVGSGAGADQPRGLEIEIVALDNPYTADPDATIRFQALYQGGALADNRITVFDRDPDGEITTSHSQSDAQGIVTFRTTPGHTYLVDTVVVRETSRDLFIRTRGAVWESLWASLTFEVPTE